MLIYPWELDIAPEKSNFANKVIVGSCIVVFLLFVKGYISNFFFNLMVLNGWNPVGLFAHTYLHSGYLHLIGNLIYLWVFGNAICSKVGGVQYFCLYTLFAVGAAAVHNFLNGAPAVGASAAIYGVIGFYFALYPTNSIRCVWTVLFRSGSFSIPAYFLIGFWVIGNTYGVFEGQSDVGYLAHLSGFSIGLITGLIMLQAGGVIMNDFDRKTLPEVFGI